MDLLAPFTGTLYTPGQEVLTAGSSVLLADGQPVASIRWQVRAQGSEVVDTLGVVLAECRPEGVLRRRYGARRPDGGPVLDLRPGVFRPLHGATLVLASGHELRIRRRIWSDQWLEFYSAMGLVGRIRPAGPEFRIRPDSYAFELFLPLLSALQAISLAQVLRMAFRCGRRQ